MTTTLAKTSLDQRIGLRAGRRPLRLMRIITRLNVGGPSYQAIYLTQRLQGPAFDCALLAGTVGAREGSMEALAAARNVRITRVVGLGREISVKSDGLTVGRLYRAMRRFRPDIVHTHLAKAGAVGRLAARMAGVPAVVHTYHGHVFHGYFSKRKTAAFLRIERLLARWTDRIVVLSEGQEQEILGFGVGRPEQMVRAPLGLELEPFLSAETQRGALRRELGIAPETPLVGIIARLVPIKAHDLFLETARRVAHLCPTAQFLIIGDGELRIPLEQQALALGFEVASHPADPTKPILRKHPGPATQPCFCSCSCSCSASPLATPSVHFLGFRADLPTLYADLDVVVLCSRNEGLPVTIIEALAAARPVVSTEVGAVRDLIIPGRTGLLAPRGDVAGLAEAIRAQLADPTAAAAMGRQGRRHVYPHLSIDRLERDIRDLYAELAEAKGLHRQSARETVFQKARRISQRARSA